jgi:hypothetical protein
MGSPGCRPRFRKKLQPSGPGRTPRAENDRNGRDFSKTDPKFLRLTLYTQNRYENQTHTNATFASLMIAALYHLPPPKR